MGEAILSSESSLYFVGGIDDGYNYRDEILELVNNEWRQVATMQNARDSHGVTVINVHDYLMFCKQG